MAASKHATSTDDDAPSARTKQDNTKHPTDPTIYSDGRPIPQKGGNPYHPGTAASEAWERGHRP